MTNDNLDLDRILSQEDAILPSSGFTARVMDAVTEEASATVPIPFPWKRAVPGLIVCLILATVWIANFAVGWRHSSASASGGLTFDRLLSMLKLGANGSAGLAPAVWVVVAILVSLGTMQLSMRVIASRK
jgi:hypothetical protein